MKGARGESRSPSKIKLEDPTRNIYSSRTRDSILQKYETPVSPRNKAYASTQVNANEIKPQSAIRLGILVELFEY